MKADIVAFLAENTGIGEEEVRYFDAGERDARSSLIPSQHNHYYYMMGYEDGCYQREICYLKAARP